MYIARHTETRRRLALKLMHADLTGDEEVERRFLREAKLACSINHPCVNGTQNLTRTGVALGTPLYMSSEQIHDRSVLS